MNKAITIAKWDFFQKVKRKSFLFFVLLFPVILIGIGILPGILQSNKNIGNKRIGIIDQAQFITLDFLNLLNESASANSLEFEKIDLPHLNFTQTKNFAEQLLETNNLSAYLALKVNSQKLYIELHNKNGFKHYEMLTLKNLFLSTYMEQNSADKLLKGFDLVEITNEEEGSLLSKFYSSYILTMLLAVMILVNGGMMTRSLREEKSNRLIELYLSSTSVEGLLFGKMISLSLIATIQIVTWGIIIFLFRDSEYLLTAGSDLFLILIYFVIAFVFYSSIFIGLGSLISTEQEAQQVNSILSLVLIFPIVISTLVIETPDSFIAQLLSYIPFTTAPIMIMRINVSSPNLLETILSLCALIISTILFVKFASKLFKIGMLSFDKKLLFADVKKILLTKN